MEEKDPFSLPQKFGIKDFLLDVVALVFSQHLCVGFLPSSELAE